MSDHRAAESEESKAYETHKNLQRYLASSAATLVPAVRGDPAEPNFLAGGNPNKRYTSGRFGNRANRTPSLRGSPQELEDIRQELGDLIRRAQNLSRE